MPKPPPMDGLPLPQGSTEALSPLMAKILADIQPPANIPESAVTTTGGANPTQIGRYHILQVIGEGGMGIVYKAEQRHPVRRTVALKLIKLGMDTRSVLARFEAERQVLALMNHANVARVFDAGITDTGRPFFVMEYVSGEPITTYCDRHRLSTRRRLELFRQACDAVHHAHQKAVIHRDIKPSNILVSVQDGNAIVKVIDFGVAKALNQRLTEHTLFTEQGQIIGTPEYMSPEQAEMNTLDIDIRTDVYSLGVVLYELLTGALPFDSKSIRHGGYTQMQQVIREVDPPRPSTRLSQLQDQAEKIAANRSTDILSLGRELHSELEWVPLKAMRKDRTDRYRSASELSDDIDNYLHFRPLIAGPQTATYRVKKFIRKHRRAAAIAAMLLLVFVALGSALAITTKRAVVARNSADEKQKLWEQEANRAREAQKAATEAGSRAESEKERAQGLLSDLFESKGRTELAAGHIEPALVYLTEAYQLTPRRASVRYQLGQACQTISAGTMLQRRGILGWLRTRSEDVQFVFSPDETRLAGLSYNSTTIWNPTDGTCIADLQRSFQGFSADGRYLLLADYQNIDLLQASDGSIVGSLKGSAACFAPDDHLLLVALSSAKYAIYEFPTRKLLGTIEIPGAAAAGSLIRANLLARTGAFGNRMTIKPGAGDKFKSIELTTPALLQFSADCQRIVTWGASDRGAHVWDMPTRRFVASLIPANGAVIACALDAHGKKLISARLSLPQEPPARLRLQAIPEPPAELTTTASLKKELVVELWSLDSSQPPMVLHKIEVSSNIWTSFGPDRSEFLDYSKIDLRAVNDKLILHFGPAQSLFVWNTSGSLMFSLDNCKAISPNGKWARGETEKTDQPTSSFGWWDVDGKTRLIPDHRELGHLAHTVYQQEDVPSRSDSTSKSRLTGSPSGKFVVAIEPEGLARVLDDHSNSSVRGMLFPRPRQFSPHKTAALIGQDADQQILFDTSTEKLTKIEGGTFLSPRPGNPIFSPDDRKLVLIAKNPPGGLNVIDVGTARVISRISVDTTSLNVGPPRQIDDVTVIDSTPVPARLIFSADSKMLAVIEAKAEPTVAEIFNLSSGQRLCMINSPQRINHGCFTPDGAVFLVATASGVIGFDARSGTPRMRFEVTAAHDLSINRTGTRLLIRTQGDLRRGAAYPPSEIQLWDFATNHLITTATAQDALFSPNGARVLVGKSALGNFSANGDFPIPSHASDLIDRLLDSESGQPLHTFENATTARFSNDSSFLVTCSVQDGARIWRCSDATLYSHIRGDRGDEIRFAELSADNSLLLGDVFRGCKLWSVPDGRVVAELPQVYPMAPPMFTPAGAIAFRNGILKLPFETRDPTAVRAWLEATIPLRIAGIELVKSSPMEQWLAEYHYRRSSLALDDPQIISLLKAMVSQARIGDPMQVVRCLQQIVDEPGLDPSKLPDDFVDLLPAAARRFPPDVALAIARLALDLQERKYGPDSRQALMARFFLTAGAVKPDKEHPQIDIGLALRTDDALGDVWLHGTTINVQGVIAHVQLPRGPNHAAYILFADASHSRLLARISPEILAAIPVNTFTSLPGATVKVRGNYEGNPDGPSLVLLDAQSLKILQPATSSPTKPPLDHFLFHYRFEDNPGDRIWKRINNDTWEERYPDGHITRFKVTSTVQEGNYQREIVRRVADDKLDDKFEVYIPPAVDGAWFQYRVLGQTDWINLARIHLND